VAEVSPLATVDFNGIGAVNTAGALELPAGNYFVSLSSRLTAGTAITVILLELRKNGVAVRSRAYAIGAGATCIDESIAFSSFVQSDGNDTVDLQITVTGTGALTSASVITILAV
jgi:hypothetical protein